MTNNTTSWWDQEQEEFFARFSSDLQEAIGTFDLKKNTLEDFFLRVESLSTPEAKITIDWEIGDCPDGCCKDSSIYYDMYLNGKYLIGGPDWARWLEGEVDYPLIDFWACEDKLRRIIGAAQDALKPPIK
jgi:hypothetical protein